MSYEKFIPQEFSGVVSVYRKDKCIFEKSYGYRDYPNNIENKVDTIFGTASAGKAFVAVAIMKLIENGKISIEQKISDIISRDLSNINLNVTIRELLNHTSGVPDYFDESISENYADLWVNFPNYKIRKNDDLLPLFMDKNELYPHGSKFQYNNSGYVLLGLLIEEVTKMPFDQFLKEEVFQVASMKNTGYYELDRLPANTATSYIFDEQTEKYYSNIYSIDTKGTGAGGCFATSNDIHLFWKSLLNGEIISKELVNEMFSIQAEDGNSKYGYGFWIANKNDDFFPYFQGSDPGTSFISSYNLNRGINITILSNFEDNVWKIHKEILTDLLDN